MSKKNSKVFGIVGSGYQSQTQLESVINVRDIKEIYVYSRDKNNRELFSNKMSEKLGISINPINYQEFINIDFDILTTVTNSITPVITKEMLTSGMHINAAGNNSWEKSEVDIDVISYSEHIICDEIEQAKIECGELMKAFEKGVFNWEESFSLSEIVSGKHKLRNNDTDITVFESQGLALEDLAMAIEIYKIALENNFGKVIKI